MPTITDATVVAQAYDTSGNGGRKIVQLNDGSLCAVLKTSTQWFLYRSTNNGTTWSNVSSSGSSSSFQDIAIATDGVRAYIIFSYVNVYVQVITYDPVTNTLKNRKDIDSGQTALGNVSLAINEAKTELHATWASKNSTYPNSFNIRYAKGTINADGTVTWGAVDQVTNANSSGLDYTEPCLVLTTSKVIIFTNEANGASTKRIRAFQKTSSWDISSISTTVYSGGSYAQSSPSAIFVPQSINGLANGRIECFWSGANSTYVSSTSLYYSYSDDLGVTWSNAVVLVQASSTINVQTPSTTFNKSGNIFVLFHYYNGSVSSVAKLVKSNGTWGSLAVIKSRTDTSGTYPSTLLDSTLSFTEPLFIYKDVSKVGFYGTWTVTTISVTPGDIGQKTDKNNILSYSITTDGTMSTITEKINGTVVNTRDTTSGQAVTLGLTQAQWDAIRFGKYADATGGKNTLTVEMGSEKWTYTFDKQLASDSDIVSASKAVKDANEVYLPSVKKQLADAINAKGGSVSSSADWLTMIGELNGVSSGRKASGTITSSSSSKTYTLYSGSASSYYYITLDISVLGFIPSVILVTQTAKVDASVTVWTYENFLSNGTAAANMVYSSSSMKNQYTGVPLDLAVSRASNQYNWIAYE